jgi:hypothetical protein
MSRIKASKAYREFGTLAQDSSRIDTSFATWVVCKRAEAFRLAMALEEDVRSQG